VILDGQPDKRREAVILAADGLLVVVHGIDVLGHLDPIVRVQFNPFEEREGLGVGPLVLVDVGGSTRGKAAQMQRGALANGSRIWTAPTVCRRQGGGPTNGVRVVMRA
jgi:hypothetical protein